MSKNNSHRKKHTFASRMGRYFFRGVITLLPVFLTIYLTWWIFSFLDGVFGGTIIRYLIGKNIPGLGILLAIFLTFIVGFLTTLIFMKGTFKLGDRILKAVPLVNMIYNTLRQVNDLIFLQRETRAFRKVCAVEYPRKGIWSIGFVTGNGVGEVEDSTRKRLANVFIPNTPSPATGFMIVVPENEVILLNMKLEDAFKLIVSGGVLDESKSMAQFRKETERESAENNVGEVK